MKWSRSTWVRVSLAVLVLAWPAAVAQASIIPVLNSVTPSGPNFVWTYEATLASDQLAQPGAVPGASTATGAGDSGATSADYFTIYDFAGFTGAHSEPAGWGFQALLLGSTPSTTTPADNPAILNLTWYRTGDAVLTPDGDVSLGLFSATSTFSDNRSFRNFTADATKDNGAASGTAIGTIGSVTGPGASIPHPASLILLSSGLGVVAVLMRRARRRPS